MKEILIICQDCFYVEYFEKLITQAFDACPIIHANNADELLANQASLNFDLALLILDSSKNNSLESCQKLKAISKNSFPFFVLFTEEDISGRDKNLLLDAGVDAVFKFENNAAFLKQIIENYMAIWKDQKFGPQRQYKLFSNTSFEANEHYSNNIYKQFYDVSPVAMGLLVNNSFVQFNNAFARLIELNPITNLDENPILISKILPFNGNEIIQKIHQISHFGKFETEAQLLSLNGISHEVKIIILAPFEEEESNGFPFTIIDLSEDKRNQSLRDFFYELNHSVNINTSMKDLLKLLQNKLNAIIDASNFYVALYNIIDDTLSLPYFADEFDKFESVPLDKTLASLVIRSKESCLLKRSEIEEFIRKGEINLYGTMAEAWLGVPLIIDGKLIGMMAVQSYISENAYNLKDIKFLEFLSTQLAVLIERKDNEIKLREALKKADASDKLKTAFLSNMSHEVRTPMNAIMGFSSLLDSDEISAEDKKVFVSLVLENGNNLLRIIDDIVDISKLEAGEIHLSKADTTVFELLQDVHESLKKELEKVGKSQLIFELEVNDKLVNLQVKTDPFRLKQVLNNLLSNAIKYTQNGKISFGFIEKEENFLEFFVSDTGTGIRPENITKIFEHFRQLEDNDSKVFGGNGLGLSISKKLVDLMGGEIRVESIPNQGTTFTFTILADKTKFVLSPLKKNHPSYNWQGKTILIAEDVLTNYQYLEALLERTKVKLIWAKNGKEAVEMVEMNRQINLILMDIQMPILNGLQASRIIKERQPLLPIIAQTAFDMMTSKEEIKRAGCDDYISKPIKSGELLAMIDRWI